MITVLDQPRIGMTTQGRRGLPGVNGVDGTNGTNGTNGLDGKGFGAVYRPGDTPGAFTSYLSGGPTSASPSPAGVSKPSAEGAVFSLAASATIATRDAIWLEPEAFFAVRFVFGRDADPATAGVSGAVAGIQWLDANYAAISQSIVQSFPALAVKDGQQVLSARVPSTVDDPLAITPPAGAAFWRPFIRDVSIDGMLSVASITVSDVTNSGVYAPDISRLVAEIRALKSRVTQLGG